MHFHFRNVNDAFDRLVNGIALKSIPTVEWPSRNGLVLKVTEPVLVSYTHPLQRVLFNSERDANPFFHLFESLWMLSGSNKVQPLAYYNSNIGNYSDDGEKFHGAYGHRWRVAFGMDQLLRIADALEADPDCRRQVLSIWSPTKDLETDSKDLPCLAGNTKFRSPEGDQTIQWLAKKFQTQNTFKYPVYTVDTGTGDQRLAWMTNAWKSGKKEVYRIKFDDNSSVLATNDHLFYRKTRRFEGSRCVGLSVQECTLGNLVVGDHVVAALPETAASRYCPKGYLQFKRNLYRNTSGVNLKREHREYFGLVEPIHRGFAIHHRDGNILNNQFDNLQQMEASQHNAIGKFGANNPHCKMTESQKDARGKKHSASLKRHYAGLTPELRKALQQRKAFRTEEQWEMIQEYQASKGNHRVVSVERAGTLAVYDFEVPGRHNAVLSNGVLVHNCNTNVYFSVHHQERDMAVWKSYLDMTVCNRSNDLVWGMLGANVVHYSFLLEYMAKRIGVEVGTYHHLTNNLHVYKDKWEPKKWASNFSMDYQKPWELIPLVDNPDVFDMEVIRFVSRGIDQEFTEPFLRNVAQPMCAAYRAHKQRRYYGDNNALTLMSRVHAPDWKEAGTAWIEKRKEAWEHKSKVAPSGNQSDG